MKGHCRGCGEYVHDDGGYHSRTEHHPDCDGRCMNCPVAVECGPVTQDDGYEGEQEATP